MRIIQIQEHPLELLLQDLAQQVPAKSSYVLLESHTQLFINIPPKYKCLTYIILYTGDKF